VKAAATQAEYRRIAAKAIERWGKERYAKAAEQVMRGAFLSPAIDQWISRNGCSMRSPAVLCG